MPALKNHRREALAQEIVKAPCGDQWLAAQKAGFRGNQKCLAVTASRLLRDIEGHPSEVRARVMELQGRAADRAVLTRADLLNSLAPVITTVDIGKFYNPDGSLKPIHELDADCRAAIKSLKIATAPGRKGKGRTKIIDFEPHDRRPYVDTYAKIAGYLKDQIELTGAGGKPLFPQMSPTEQARRLAFILAKAQKAAATPADKPKG